MQQVLTAQQLPADRGIAADVYSVTSYSLLYRDAVECEAWNRDHRDEPDRQPHLTEMLAGKTGRFIAVSD